MKTHHRRPRIRQLRRRAGLSQRDLALLLGYRTHGQVSRYENGRRVPTTDEALALQVIFGVVPSGQFPELHERTAQVVVARIDRLLRRERKAGATGVRPSRRAMHLQRVLDSIRRQLTPGMHAHEPWPNANKLSDSEDEVR